MTTQEQIKNMKGTYTLRYKCHNCDKISKIRFKKGEKPKASLINFELKNVKCPNCGLEELEREESQ